MTNSSESAGLVQSKIKKNTDNQLERKKKKLRSAKI